MPTHAKPRAPRFRFWAGWPAPCASGAARRRLSRTGRKRRRARTGRGSRTRHSGGRAPELLLAGQNGPMRGRACGLWRRFTQVGRMGSANNSAPEQVPLSPGLIALLSPGQARLAGPSGHLPIPAHDKATLKLAMLLRGPLRRAGRHPGRREVRLLAPRLLQGPPAIPRLGRRCLLPADGPEDQLPTGGADRARRHSAPVSRSGGTRRGDRPPASPRRAPHQRPQRGADYRRIRTPTAELPEDPGRVRPANGPRRERVSGTGDRPQARYWPRND